MHLAFFSNIEVWFVPVRAGVRRIQADINVEVFRFGDDCVGLLSREFRSGPLKIL
jgi:hypothetical protein